MKSKEARELGKHIATHIGAGEIEKAYELLAPVLAKRTPFAKLDLIGETIGSGDLDSVNTFLELIRA
ncbi:MAG: hypothetical protein PVG14_16300, partial [Anaerolineales bacterium]